MQRLRTLHSAARSAQALQRTDLAPFPDFEQHVNSHCSYPPRTPPPHSRIRSGGLAFVCASRPPTRSDAEAAVDRVRAATLGDFFPSELRPSPDEDTDNSDRDGDSGRNVGGRRHDDDLSEPDFAYRRPLPRSGSATLEFGLRGKTLGGRLRTLWCMCADVYMWAWACTCVQKQGGIYS